MLEKDFTFKDYYKNQVTFSLRDHPFSRQPKHVITICKYEGDWLLTKHKGRGIEFPGGNVEKGETAEQAAIREVKEETGGIVSGLTYIGQYRVTGKKEQIIKNVYFGEIKKLVEQPTYFETDGPILLDEIPVNVKTNQSFSFIMKDDVMTYSLQFVEKNRLN